MNRGAFHSWSIWIQQNATLVIQWYTRRRRVGRVLCTSGVLLIIAAIGHGLTFSLKQESGGDRFVGWFSTGEGVPLILTYAAFAIGLLLLIVGMGMLLTDYVRETRTAQRRAVIVVELRGLVDTSDRPMLHAIPTSQSGQRLDAHIDIRSAMESGDFPRSLSEIEAIPEVIRRLRAHRNRADVAVAVGGVLQVPFLFYAGVLLDDEGAILQLDWDRKLGSWRQLAAPDDGTRFMVEGTESLRLGSSRVVVAVSASYGVDDSAIADTFSGLDVVTLKVPNPTPNSLWSELVQAELAAQFLQVLAELSNKGITDVELVLAAPSSLAIKFGRAYDRRNLPRVRCYQYQKDARPPYPWSVEVTEPGVSGRIVNTPAHGFLEATKSSGEKGPGA